MFDHFIFGLVSGIGLSWLLLSLAVWVFRKGETIPGTDGQWFRDVAEAIRRE